MRLNNKSWTKLHLSRVVIILLVAITFTFTFDQEAISTTATSSETQSAPRKTLFQCADGRLGLHIVHTRFLIGQANINPVFAASRLLFLRSFLIPNLNAQTSQKFILYVSHDPNLTPAVLGALTATLEHSNQPTILGTETNTTNPSFDMPTIIQQTLQWDLHANDVSIIITSRIDIDDLAHVKSVAAVQDVACSMPPLSSYKEGLSVKLVYMDRGMLWYPSMEHPYGQTCEWINAFKSHLAIMQSMILVAPKLDTSKKKNKKKHLLHWCSLNVYSYPHYKPQEVEQLLNAKECGKMAFHAKRDVVRWRPPGGKIGCLYSKSASSWSYGKLKHKGTVCQPADAARLGKLFAGSKQRLAAVNALFIGLERDAVKLLANSTTQHLE